MSLAAQGPLASCQLKALDAASLGREGDLFVLDMGQPVKILDLARDLIRLSGRDPDSQPIDVVGLRPGEKLHETMITEDDARMTRALADRYVIEPALSFWSTDHYADGAPVPDGFSYASNTNAEWLDEAGLKRLLSQTGA